MKVLLYPNLEKRDGLACTQETVAKLLELGAQPLLDAELQAQVGTIPGARYGKFSELLGECDVLLPVGGDGTILRAARHAVQVDKPILAVNAGRVGFLTQLERDELEGLRRLTEGNYTVHRRMMLEAVLIQGGKPRRFAGLNDVIISRSDADQMVDICVHAEDRMIARHRADGLVFATPTGSTAYSLSAGGPVVDPSMTMLLLTAICPHSTFHRALVLPTHCDYTVTEKGGNNPKGLTISVDGRRIGKIHSEQSVVVRKSKSSAQFIDLGLRSFYTSVNEKLSWGR